MCICSCFLEKACASSSLLSSLSPLASSCISYILLIITTIYLLNAKVMSGIVAGPLNTMSNLKLMITLWDSILFSYKRKIKIQRDGVSQGYIVQGELCCNPSPRSFHCSVIASTKGSFGIRPGSSDLIPLLQQFNTKALVQLLSFCVSVSHISFLSPLIPPSLPDPGTGCVFLVYSSASLPRHLRKAFSTQRETTFY